MQLIIDKFVYNLISVAAAAAQFPDLNVSVLGPFPSFMG